MLRLNSFCLCIKTVESFGCVYKKNEKNAEKEKMRIVFSEMRKTNCNIINDSSRQSYFLKNVFRFLNSTFLNSLSLSTNIENQLAHTHTQLLNGKILLMFVQCMFMLHHNQNDFPLFRFVSYFIFMKEISFFFFIFAFCKNQQGNNTMEHHTQKSTHSENNCTICLVHKF